MKVLHVIPSLAATEGGPTRALLSMAEVLERAGVAITVVTTGNGWRAHTDTLKDGSAIRRFPTLGPSAWHVSPALAWWLRQHLREFDLVHIHSLFSFPTLVAARAARRQGIPYILRPLGSLDAWSLRQKSWKKRPYYRCIEQRNLRGAAAVQATAERELEGFRQLGWGNNLALVPLGVPIPPPARPEAAGDRLRLLFLSRLHPKKNLETALEALARLATDRFTLTVAGSGDAEYVAELRRRTERLGLTDRVRFVGWVDEAGRRDWFCRSDALLLPSRQENFGLAVAEALAAGLPVLISREVALADEVDRARAGIVLPLQDVAAWAQAIEAMSDPETRRRYAEQARRLAEERFSLEAMQRSLLELYRQVLAGAQGV